ncbi:MAG: tRNA pseudouridine(55) synthase TruB [Candidatus Gracilibacteria bacterium]|nr:tRNA pseudouridine(55) synthase TruB [Candidatus Gracilibacteria bacterium]
MKAFYFIDKPLNFTSFDVIRKLKKILNTKKIGHTGTLDPLATGGLLVAVGKYTRLIPFLEKDRKTYEFEISLDGTTDSFDLGEEINYLSEEKQDYYKKNLTLEQIKQEIKNNFTGKITQIPPKYSALKIGGKRACDLLREGKKVDITIKSREVEIFDIKISDYSYPKLKLEATVSAGTYIRSIANDLGEILGTGGYITFLRRIKIANLDIKNANNLDETLEKLDIKKLFGEEKFIELNNEELSEIKAGRYIENSYKLAKNKAYFVLLDNEIVSVIEVVNNEENENDMSLLKAKINLF